MEKVAQFRESITSYASRILEFPPKRNKVDRFFLFVQCFGKDQVERIGSVMMRYAVKMSELALMSSADCSSVRVGKW